MSYKWGRRLQVKGLQVVVRLNTLFHEHHEWVLPAYFLVFVGFISKGGFLIEIGHA